MSDNRRLIDGLFACVLLINVIRCRGHPVNSSLDPSRASPTTAPLVSLDIYYETLCIDSVAFIVGQLHPTLQKIGHIVNVSMIPFGIARERLVGGKYAFSCQHGPKECYGNIVQTCAIHLLTLTDPALPVRFIYCMQRSRDPSSTGQACAKEIGIDFVPMRECAEGRIGNKLQHEMAQRTLALRPKLNWVPWIVLNNQHNDEIQIEGSRNLLGLICKTYQGIMPDGC